MKRRLIEIINELSDHSNQTLEKLAKKHNMTIRTIRNDLKSINIFLNTYGFKPIEIEKNGLIQTDPSFSMCRQYLQIDNVYDYKLSKEERIITSSIILLMSPRYITLSQIADELYVSRTTIIKDLQDIRKYLTQMNIRLLSHPNKGLQIYATEKAVRDALLQIFVLDHDTNDLLMKYLSKTYVFTTKNYSKILTNIINEIESEYQVSFTEDSFTLFYFYLKLMVERNSQNIYIDKVVHSYGKPYRYAQDILRYVCQYCDITTNENEINYLAHMIKNTLHYTTRVTNDREAIAIQVLTRQLIEHVSHELQMDLTRDYQLYENLSNHLNAIYHQPILEEVNNPVLQDIRDTQKEIIQIVNKNIHLVESFFSRSLTETDIVYIVIHFCAAIERYKTTKIDYNVILICNAGIGTSQLVSAKLVKHFHINIVGIISSHEIHTIHNNSADLLVSTVPIYEAPIEFVNITPHVTEDDYLRIGNKLTKLQLHHHAPVKYTNNKITQECIMNLIHPILYDIVPDQANEIYNSIHKSLHKYFNKVDLNDNRTDINSPFLHHLLAPDFITLDVECSDWRDAIRKSAQSLLKYGYIENTYITSMIKGVEEYGPYIEIAPGLAIPHAGLNDGSYHTGMSLIRLLKPVCFGVDELDPVRYVVTLATVDQKVHLRALFHLLSLWQNKKFIAELDTATTSLQVSRIIKKFEYTLNDY